MGMIYIVFKNVVIEHGSFEDKVLKNRKVNVDDLYLWEDRNEVNIIQVIIIYSVEI